MVADQSLAVRPKPEEPKRKAFGKAMREEFLFDPAWTNLNHGALASLQTTDGPPKESC